jgi:hypothetical protein
MTVCSSEKSAIGRLLGAMRAGVAARRKMRQIRTRGDYRDAERRPSAEYRGGGATTDFCCEKTKRPP